MPVVELVETWRAERGHNVRVTQESETFEQWRERTAPPPARPWSRRKRLIVAALVLVLGMLIAVPGGDHEVATALLVLTFAVAIALSDDAVPRWLQLVVLLPLGCLAIFFSEPSRGDWIGYGAIALVAIGSDVFTRWREKRR